MKRSNYSILFKILASVAVASVFYAAVFTIRTAAFGTDGGLLSAVYFLFTIVLGYMSGIAFLSRIPKFAIKASESKPVKFVSFMLNMGDAAVSVSAFVAWTLILLPIFTALFIFYRYGAYRAVFEMIVAIMIYVLSLRHSQFKSSKIMSDLTAYIGFITLALCLELLHFFDEMAYLKPWLLAISYFFILAYLLIKNQEDIESNIFDKKHIEKSILPRNLRRLNTVWVCMLFIAIILLFNLKTMVILLLQLLGKISIFIVSAYLWMIGLLFQSTGAAQQGGTAKAFSFFGTGSEMIKPFENLLSNTLRNAVALYILYRILLLLIRQAPGLARKVGDLIRRLFALGRRENEFETADFSDETETVKPTREIDQRRYLMKKMKKSGRTLKSISDPVEKVRYMYASIMAMLPVLGIKAEQSDTTADILKKAAASADISKEFSPLTGIYNQVRYGGKIPDGEVLMKAEGHFDKTVEVIGHK